MSLGGSLWTALLAVPLVAALFYGVFGSLVLMHAEHSMMKLQLDRLLARVDHAEAEVKAIVNIRSITGPIPLQMGGWAMHAVLGETIAREIALNQPRLVLECGSGSSTAFIASCLSKFCPGGRVVSLDHESGYAERTRRLLHQVGVAEWAEVVVAPLQTHQINGQEGTWYGFEPATLGEQRIDLLLVDGPPGNQAQLARYPAVPILRPHLAENVVVILDDGNRPDEQEIARLWANELDGSLERVKSHKGVWVIRRGKGFASQAL